LIKQMSIKVILEHLDVKIQVWSINIFLHSIFKTTCDTYFMHSTY
jgi:hypothetical protein